MAKQLNVILDDEDHEALFKAKGRAIVAGIHHDIGETMSSDPPDYAWYNP